VTESADNRHLAACIDHTLLRADAQTADIQRLCQEAADFGFAAVCVNPSYAALAVSLLCNCPVRVAAVANFPLGASTDAALVAETCALINAGVDEIDMVMNIAAAKDGNWQAVDQGIQAVVGQAQPAGLIVKLIIETCLLSEAEKVRACAAALAANVDFVKTSTGFSTSGATLADVCLLRRSVGQDIGVKASGGIRTREDALAMLAAGANRLGTSFGVAIIGQGQQHPAS